ncbi:SGNH/GDSL hydrolase family protein [soil metagenome]
MSDGSIVFIGDSITDSGRLQDPEGLGDGYVRIVAERLSAAGDERTIVNTGISGNRLPHLASRWQVDALAHKPATLSVFVGINDVWRRFDDAEDGPTETAEFESGYRDLLTQARDDFAPRMVLVEPFLVPINEDQRGWATDLDEKREIVAKLASEFRASFVPLHEIMTMAAASHGARLIASDGVHPSAFGSGVIADAWMRAEQQLS